MLLAYVLKLNNLNPMPNITFLKPIDQPLGHLRLISELANCLNSPQYSQFKFAVGFAKVGPLARLNEHIQKWKNGNNKIEGIFGIDQQGTSIQALQYALLTFNKVYVTRATSSRQSTFHPKLYVFYGEEYAVGYYGSHNLTVGGTETNFEGGVKLEFNLSVQADKKSFDELFECWTSLLPENCSATELLTQTILDAYIYDNLLLDELIRAPRRIGKQVGKTTTSTFKVKPPSSLPKSIIERKPAVPPVQTGQTKSRAAKPKSFEVLPSETLVIQIVPHHNGEIFLSKIAVNQNPDFFEFPFKGQTIPKISSNKSYPQRIPDPIVNINIFDTDGKLIPELNKQYYPLNMVFYEAKSEIRITVNPELAREIPSHSILLMSRSEDVACDYEMDIYSPGSEQFNNYLDICNITMPSGGAIKPRKMGWL